MSGRIISPLGFIARYFTNRRQWRPADFPWNRLDTPPKSPYDAPPAGEEQAIEKAIRKGREWFPYPRFWARLTGARIPTRFMTGKKTGLVRPEAVAFSLSGDLMAISNSGQNSITLYRKIPASEGQYAPEPCCTISDPDRLDYVHDIAFTPCGKFLTAVARESHSLSMFSLKDGGSRAFHADLLWSVSGEECGLNFPAGVSIHPSGNWFAVANRMKCGIAIYRRTDSEGMFETKPFQTIDEEDLAAQGLAAPHGVEFSPDGMVLMAVHKRFFKNKDPKGESALITFACRPAPDLGVEPEPREVIRYGSSCLHALAIHPTGHKVAMAQERGGVDVLNRYGGKVSTGEVDRFSVLQVRDGAKGVAFTRDGRQLVVTTPINEVLFFDLSGKK